MLRQIPEPDYKLTIIPTPEGGYRALIESIDGDLWAGVEQDPQRSGQFSDSLLVVGKRCGIPVEIKDLFHH